MRHPIESTDQSKMIKSVGQNKIRRLALFLLLLLLLLLLLSSLLLSTTAATNDDEVKYTHLASFTAYYFKCRKTEIGRTRMKVSNDGRTNKPF